MAEIFDASGVAGGGGVDFTHAINATLESFKNAADQLTGSSNDLSHSAYLLEKATDKLTGAAGKMAGVGTSASGSQFAIPFAKKIPTATPLESPGLAPEQRSVKVAFGHRRQCVPHQRRQLAKTSPSDRHSVNFAPVATAVTGAFLGSHGGGGSICGINYGCGIRGQAFHRVHQPCAPYRHLMRPVRDLGAVVGTLLRPSPCRSHAISEGVRGLPSIPIVLQILPSFTTAIRAISEAWIAQLPILANLASVFVGIVVLGALELVRLFVDVMLPIYRAISAVTAGLAAAFKSFLPIIGGDLRGTFKTLGETVALVGIALAGLAFKFLGMNDALGAMINDLKNGPAKADATGLAVATNARYTDPASLGKELAQRAFVSSGRGDQPGQNDPQAEFRAKSR